MEMHEDLAPSASAFGERLTLSKGRYVVMASELIGEHWKDGRLE